MYVMRVEPGNAVHSTIAYYPQAGAERGKAKR